MMSRVKHCLITFLVAHLIFAGPVIAAAGSPPSAAILPVVSNKDSVEGQLALELAHSLSRDLEASVNMITPDLLSQTNKTANITGLSGQYLDLYKRFSAARNQYSLEGHVGQAIAALKDLGDELLQSLEFNREFSKLYESTRLATAWIYFQEGETDKATQVVREILAARPGSIIDSLGYPGNFRAFLTRESKHKTKETAVLTVVSRPSAVDVFVNGIYSGNSSIPITVSSGALQISVASSGRKTVHKNLTVSAGEKRTIHMALSWKNGKDKTLLPTDVEDSFAQLSLSSAINQGVHADKVVFLGVQHDLKGYHVFAKVYDQGFHQPLTTIKYPKLIQNIKTEAPRLREYIATKIRPYLLNPANHLWKDDYDPQIRMDDRIALRHRESIFRKPGFWATAGTVVIGGTILGIALSQRGSSSSASGGDGSVMVDLGGFQGVRK